MKIIALQVLYCIAFLFDNHSNQGTMNTTILLAPSPGWLVMDFDEYNENRLAHNLLW
jgi:hypothetical protein